MEIILDQLNMKPSSSLRSAKPLMNVDDLSWQMLCFERKKRKLHRKCLSTQYEIQLAQFQLKAQHSARRDWMLFSMMCILILIGMAWIGLQAWLEMRIVLS